MMSSSAEVAFTQNFFRHSLDKGKMQQKIRGFSHDWKGLLGALRMAVYDFMRLMFLA